MRPTTFKISLLLLGIMPLIAADVVAVLALRAVQLQNAADAAARGALYELKHGKADWVAAGKADSALNGFSDGLNGVTIVIEYPPASGFASGDTAAVRAVLLQRIPGSFMGWTNRWGPVIRRSAVAKQVTRPIGRR